MWAKLSEVHEAAREINELGHRGWSDAEALDAWDRLFVLQSELAVMAHRPPMTD
jgi:hypothetical protein